MHMKYINKIIDYMRQIIKKGILDLRHRRENEYLEIYDVGKNEGM